MELYIAIVFLGKVIAYLLVNTYLSFLLDTLLNETTHLFWLQKCEDIKSPYVIPSPLYSGNTLLYVPFESLLISLGFMSVYLAIFFIVLTL